MIEISPLDVSAPLDRESRAIWSWASADMLLAARTPQAVSFARDAAATVSDFAGTSYAVVPHQPAWHYVSEIPTLLLADNDRLFWNFARHPSAMTGMIEGYFRSGINAGGGMWYVGNADADEPRIWIEWDGSFFRIVHDNADDAPVDSTLDAAPTNGQHFRLRWEVFPNGSVRLHQSINAANETSADQSGAHALAAAWGGDPPRLYLNSVGDGNPGEASYRRGIVVPGSGRTLAQLEAVY